MRVAVKQRCSRPILALTLTLALALALTLTLTLTLTPTLKVLAAVKQRCGDAGILSEMGVSFVEVHRDLLWSLSRPHPTPL